MTFNKWLRLKKKRESIAQVVERIMRSRIAALIHYLPLAAQGQSKSVEAVYQLRVWCRRTEAGLKLCKKWLSRHERRKLAKQVKKIRIAAGQLRDLDVLQQHVGKQLHGALRTYLLEQIKTQRTAAQPALKAICRELKSGKKLQKWLDQFTQRLAKKSRRERYQKPFVKWCEKRLTPWVENFTAGVGPAATDIRAWHKYRIAGKRLRYVWEIAAGVAPVKERKTWCTKLATLQANLGELNDLDQRVKQYQTYYDALKQRSLRSALLRVIRSETGALAAMLEKLNAVPQNVAEESEATGVEEHILPLHKKIRRSKAQG